MRYAPRTDIARAAAVSSRTAACRHCGGSGLRWTGWDQYSSHTEPCEGCDPEGGAQRAAVFRIQMTAVWCIIATVGCGYLALFA